MVSNYDEKAMKIEISEGKRHYNKQKKTSLFGSESPRTHKNKTNHNRYINSKTNTNSVEENILNQGEILRREREFKESKQTKAAERRSDLEACGHWDKANVAGENLNYPYEPSGSRAKWEYDQELKKMDEYKNSDEKTYPGFPSGFGRGNIRKDGRRRSDVSSNGDELKTTMNYPFTSPGEGASVITNQEFDNEPRQKMEEAKAYADHLENEIQRMKSMQMEDKYSSIKTNNEGKKNDNNANLDYDDDALYREAENRARLRELERLKESYEQNDNRYDSDFISNQRKDEHEQESNVTYHSKDKEMPRLPKKSNDLKRTTFSSTHNDFRKYSMEEYLNSRQQLVNPSQLKRTTLSGSEDLTLHGKYQNGDFNQNFKIIDGDNIIKQQNNISTYKNTYTPDRKFSVPKPGSYAMKTPYATD